MRRLLSACLIVAAVVLLAQLCGLNLFETTVLLGACPTVVDRLRMRTEDLGPTLHHVASWLDPWLNVIPRGTYPKGAGLVRSTFTIGRSFPTTDEETWDPITVTSGENYIGSCPSSFDSVDFGYKERLYAPESRNLVGPLQCVDDFTLNWQSETFWNSYMAALQKRAEFTITNRLANIYMNLVPKAAANTDFHFIDGNTDTNMPSAVDLSELDISSCDLIQDYLDYTAAVLMRAGATVPDSDGWITMSEQGPLFPLLIGIEASARLSKNNAEFRTDNRFAFEGFGDANPLLKRIGASRIIKNFRHVVTLAPPRWKIVDGAYVRVPTYIMTTPPGAKGSIGDFNPDWLDPEIATHEGAIVLNPMVFTEEILVPDYAGLNFPVQNYFGEWMFVTGNDAVLGFTDCTGIVDPTHTRGRHFARYKHSANPIHPEYGALIVFARCPALFDCSSCVS